MFLPHLLSVDFVSWWKAASILLTGFFGILGLLTEFKEQPTKTITKWGKLALIGIIVSTGFGIYSQLLETAGQNEKRAEDTRQALHLLWSNQQTLNAIERSLSLLDEPSVWAIFRVSCDGQARPTKVIPPEDQRSVTEKMERFCKAIELFNQKTSDEWNEWPEQIWKLWPNGPAGLFTFSILVSRQNQAHALESELDAAPVITFFGTPKTADWFMHFEMARSPNLTTTVKFGRYHGLFGNLERVKIAPVSDLRPDTNGNNG